MRAHFICITIFGLCFFSQPKLLAANENGGNRRSRKVAGRPPNPFSAASSVFRIIQRERAISDSVADGTLVSDLLNSEDSLGNGRFLSETLASGKISLASPEIQYFYNPLFHERIRPSQTKKEGKFLVHRVLNRPFTFHPPGIPFDPKYRIRDGGKLLSKNEAAETVPLEDWKARAVWLSQSDLVKPDGESLRIVADLELKWLSTEESIRALQAANESLQKSNHTARYGNTLMTLAERARNTKAIMLAPTVRNVLLVDTVFIHREFKPVSGRQLPGGKQRMSAGSSPKRPDKPRRPRRGRR